jgi:hypothetical protein
MGSGGGGMGSLREMKQAGREEGWFRGPVEGGLKEERKGGIAIQIRIGSD